MIIDFSKYYNNHINKKIYDFLGKQSDIIICFGGSGSGKSFTKAQRVISDLLRGRQYLILRKTQVSILRSVYNEILEKISLMELDDYFIFNKGREITCKLNNCQVIFCGVDNPQKLKSIRPKKGVFTDIWFEEATEFTKDDFKEVIKRVRGASEHKKRFTLTFNPINKQHWIAQEYFYPIGWTDNSEEMEGDINTLTVSILKTTYRDNKYLNEDDIKILESETDNYYRDVYLLGLWGKLENQVYRNYKIEDFEDNFKNYSFGLDWGFSNDEGAVVKIGWNDLREKKLYICKEVYERNLLNSQLIEMVKEILPSDKSIYCDSAEPKSIEEFIQSGILARPCKKGNNSIQQGIKFLQQFEIIIHHSCVNFYNEISSYHFKKDSNGNILPEPVDKNNHLLDSARYAMGIYFGDNIQLDLPPFRNINILEESKDNTILHADCLIYCKKDNSLIHLLLISKNKIMAFTFPGTWDINLENLHLIFKAIHCNRIFIHAENIEDTVLKFNQIGIPAMIGQELKTGWLQNTTVFNKLDFIIPSIFTDNSKNYIYKLKAYDFTNKDNEDILHSFGLLLANTGYII